MTIFLINANIVCYRYMGKTSSHEENNIVEANDEEEASEKLRAHYKAQDNECDRTFYVDINYVNKIIR